MHSGHGVVHHTTLLFPQVKTMRGVIENIDGMRTTIRLEDGDPLVWPTNKLPAGCHLMSVVEVSMNLGSVEGSEHADESRQRLNDILTSQPET